MNPVLLTRTNNVITVLNNLKNGANCHQINQLLCKIQICVVEQLEERLIEYVEQAESYACDVAKKRVGR
jgi:hypothetical protein